MQSDIFPNRQVIHVHGTSIQVIKRFLSTQCRYPTYLAVVVHFSVTLSVATGGWASRSLWKHQFILHWCKQIHGAVDLYSNISFVYDNSAYELL